MLYLTPEEYAGIPDKMRALKEDLCSRFPDCAKLVSMVVDDLKDDLARHSSVPEMRDERTINIPNNYLFFNAGPAHTELLKQLAVGLAAVFGKKEMLLAFDMSDYRERHRAVPAPLPELLRLIQLQNRNDPRLLAYEAEVGKRRSKDAYYRLWGTPPGYEGMDAGEISEALIADPRRLILLLGIENAHHSVLDSFGPILDEGRGSTGAGRKLDFSQSMILMTTSIESARQLYDRLSHWFVARVDNVINCQRPQREWWLEQRTDPEPPQPANPGA